MQPVEFIYFDLGGVLYEYLGALKKITDQYKIDYEELRNIIHSYHTPLFTGQMTLQEVWQIFNKDNHIQVPADFDLMNAWLDNSSPILETQELLKNLSETYRIGLLTNAYLGTVERLLDTEKIPTVDYSAIVDSCKVHLLKPDKDMFEFAQNKAEVPANRILFIDDKESYVSAAKALGWQSVMFNAKHPTESIRLINQLLNR